MPGDIGVFCGYFYLQYEKMKYWIYKEEIFEELKRSSRI